MPDKEFKFTTAWGNGKHSVETLKEHQLKPHHVQLMLGQAIRDFDGLPKEAQQGLKEYIDKKLK